MKASIFRTKIIVTIIFISASLTACGGAPSESDMKKAIDIQLQAEMTAAKQFMGGAGASMAEKLMPKIESLKKIGCKDDGENAYRCDLELEVTQNGITNKAPTRMRFVKGRDGWVASK
jgi:hypothetical protein